MFDKMGKEEVLRWVKKEKQVQDIKRQLDAKQNATIDTMLDKFERIAEMMEEKENAKMAKEI